MTVQDELKQRFHELPPDLVYNSMRSPRPGHKTIRITHAEELALDLIKQEIGIDHALVFRAGLRYLLGDILFEQIEQECEPRRQVKQAA